METSATANNKLSESCTMLAPGFRFHPTDEELVRYYLRRKVCGKGFRVDAISHIDIYKAEPWDLPSFSKLKTRDLEWYFFSILDKKYGNGSKTNRATERGYWKTTGKDRAVYHKSQVVGMKKTLVYHSGRAPKGLRTEWVMHEYRLCDMDLDRAGIAQNAFVLCRVFCKSGSGPKNGERYGAPLIEEEWEDDELELVPKNETDEIIDFDGDAYLDEHDIEQILGANSDASPLLLNTNNEDASFDEETASNSGKLLFSVNGKCCELLPSTNGDGVADFPASCDTNLRVVKHEYIGESSQSVNSDYLAFLLDEPFLDSSDHPFGGGFVEDDNVPNDSSDLGMINEYLTFFDPSDAIAANFSFDQPSVERERDQFTPEHVLFPPEVAEYQEPLKDGNKHSSLPNQQLVDNQNGTNTAPALDKLDSGALHGSGFDLLNPLVKHSSKILGSLPAPPAFASELTLKDAAALHLHSLSHSSSSSHVAAGIIQIMDLTTDARGRNQFLEKHQDSNVVISLGFSRGIDGSATVESSLSIHPGKMIRAISRSLFSFAFFWVIIMLSITFKGGPWITAK